MKSLKATLFTLVGSGIAAAAAIAVVAYVGMANVERDSDAAYTGQSLTSDILPPPLYLVELRLLVSRTAEGSENLPAALKRLEQLEKDFHDRLRYWHEHPIQAVPRVLLDKQADTGEHLVAGAHAVLEALAERASPEQIQPRLKAVDAAFLAHSASTNEVVAAADAYADQMVKAAAEKRAVLHVFVASLAGAALLLLTAMGYVLGRGVFARIGAEPHVAAAMAGRVAGGDLVASLDGGEHREESIIGAMGRMCEGLRDMVMLVRDTADHIATGSQQIAVGNADLSSRTERQASSLQETAASMEQLRITVRNNSDAAIQAAELAASAAQVARHGHDVVNGVVATMGDIATSSNRIGDIIGVIDGIAFQTNILALNAAVEAARAGEQGRGFAVVAAEVRALAQRSASAAREIKDLIATSGQKVASGTALVAQAGQTISEVVVQVKRVNDLMCEIRAAGSEQSAGIEQIAVAVTVLDQSTQQNAALVEESAAAAASLRGQADQLTRLVARFKTGPAAASRAPG